MKSSDDRLLEEHQEIISDLLGESVVPDRLSKRIEKFLAEVEIRVEVYAQIADDYKYAFQKYAARADRLATLRNLLQAERNRRNATAELKTPSTSPRGNPDSEPV